MLVPVSVTPEHCRNLPIADCVFTVAHTDIPSLGIANLLPKTISVQFAAIGDGFAEKGLQDLIDDSGLIESPFSEMNIDKCGDELLFNGTGMIFERYWW